MDEGGHDQRTSRRPGLEAAALGALVLVVVLLARGLTESAPTSAAAVGEEALPTADVPPPPPPATEPEQIEAPRSLPIAASEEAGLDELASRIARGMDDFDLLRIEEFGDGESRRRVAIYAHPRSGLEFSLVPAGRYWMGSADDELGRDPDEGLREARVSTAFLIARTECTVAAWHRAQGSSPPGGEDVTVPMIDVTASQVRRWCAQLGLRLPTEIEWEYACRAGTRTRFWNGDSVGHLAAVGWFDDNHPGALQPVGQLPPNPFGLFDMHGNVWEWCEDVWMEDPEDSAAQPGSPVRGSRVVRGGSHASPPSNLRSASRDWYAPRRRSHTLGFRPVRTVLVE